jgi:hypothetical protein
MARVATVVRKQPWDVEARLHGLNLDRPGMLKVRTVARSAAADATPFHPLNSPGTLAYHFGTFALRDGNVGKNWQVARPEGVEGIYNASKNILVVFSNVDVACNDFIEPKPRSKKGAGAERVAQDNLFGALPTYAPQPKGGMTVFYFMVDEKGACELSVPVVEDGTFTAYIERNFLSDGGDLADVIDRVDNDGPMDNFDPQVIRKRG